METFDWQRMVFGELSWGFALEIVVRTVIMYVYTFGMVRLMGKRTAQQLSPFEFLIVIALGSSVGDPMFYEEVPLLAGLLVITIVVALEQVLSIVGQRNPHFERLVEGKPHTLIIDGRIDFSGMRHETLAIEELFGELRKAGVEQLGQVKYAYLEQSGAISILLYRSEKVKPGLPIVPPRDIRRPASFTVPNKVSEAGIYACLKCGQRHTYQAEDTLILCPACASGEWSKAVMEVDVL